MCGATTPTDARFCPTCGARVGVAVVDLTAPPSTERTERDGQDASRPRPVPLLVGAAVVLVAALAGLWLVSGDADEPDDAAEPTPAAVAQPTTTDTAEPTLQDSVQPADQTLESVLSIRSGLTQVEELFDPGQGSSVGLVAIGDTLYWLTGEVTTSAWGLAEGGHADVEVRRSDDGGETWTVLDHDLPADAILGTTAAGEGEVVAAGTDGNGWLTIWRSPDGVAWAGETLAGDDESSTTIRTPTALVPTSDGLIVLTRNTPDVGVLDPLIPGGSTELTVSVTTSNGESRLVFFGPFQLRVDGPTIEALTPEMRAVFDELSAGGRDSAIEGSIWVEGQDGWTATEVEGQPTDAVLLPDGTPLIIGHAGERTIEWTPDGSGGWSGAATPHLVSVATWQGQTIATGPGDLQLRSESGWEPYGLMDAPSEAARDPFLVAADANDEIVAVSLIAPLEEPATTIGPGLLTKDGFVLTYAPSESLVAVSTPSGATVTMAPWQPSLPDAATLDVERGVLVVRDPDGDAEVAFTLRELGELERATTGAVRRGGRAEVLFSADGRTWSRGRVDDSTVITQVLAVDDGVLAVAGRWGPPGSGAVTSSVRLVRVSLG